MAKRGRPWAQKRVCLALRDLAIWNDYYPEVDRKPIADKGRKGFRPDVVATPNSKAGRATQVFEVEANISNNTVYKSLFSLLRYVGRRKGSVGYFVCPPESMGFVRQCISDLVDVIRVFGRKVRGRQRGIPLDVLSFEDVRSAYGRRKSYDDQGGRGRPPKCSFLPR